MCHVVVRIILSIQYIEHKLAVFISTDMASFIDMIRLCLELRHIHT